MTAKHVLTIVRGNDWMPDEPDWDWDLTCVDFNACDGQGWWECGVHLAHTTATYKARDEGRVLLDHPPACDAPAPGEWNDDEDEILAHGVWHTYRYGWGWTVPYPGCVLVGHDNIADHVWEIARTEGTGTYLVIEDWDDTDVAALDVMACVWPRPPSCPACGEPLIEGVNLIKGAVALLNTGEGCVPLALPGSTYCTGIRCQEERNRAALTGAIERGVIASEPCDHDGCDRTGVWERDGRRWCDEHEKENP